MRFPRTLAALLLLVGLPENQLLVPADALLASREAAADDTPSVGHPLDVAVAKKVTDLSDPSWYACSTAADCTLEGMTSNCDWIVVRSDKAFEYRQIYPRQWLGTRPYNDNEFGPICKDPRLDPSKPLPMAVCTSGRCVRADCPPGRKGPGGWCVSDLERATHPGLY